MTAETIQKYKKIKTSKLKQKAISVFNKFIRERDSDGDYFTCLMCGKTKRKGADYHACHFFSAGHHDYLRFDEDNVHGGCRRCNYYLSGNLIEYENNLIKKIGPERVEYLKLSVARHKQSGWRGWDRISLIQIIEKYK